jgi:hypothetical protein
VVFVQDEKCETEEKQLGIRAQPFIHPALIVGKLIKPIIFIAVRITEN